MDLAIVTVSYNTAALLADCLASALAGIARSGLSAEVWVVDNASADGSAALVQAQFPSVHLIALDRNIGFASGNNAALQQIEEAGSGVPRHVLFLNPDTRVTGDALGALVRFLDTTPKAGVCGARLVNGDGSFQHSAFRFAGLAQILFDFFPIHHRLVDSRLNGRYPLSLYRAGKPFVVDHPLGAALMIRSEALRAVGPFDERFFMYCEEVDLCWRVRATGFLCYCAPQAEIVHLVAQSTRQSREQMFVQLWRSRFLLYEKHRSQIFCWLARRLVRLGLSAEAHRARGAYLRGEIDGRQLQARLAACGEVAGL